MDGAGGKPRLVDSHAHLDMPEFDADRADAVRRASAAGVVAIFCPADLTRAGSLPSLPRRAAAPLPAPPPRRLAGAGIIAAVEGQGFRRGGILHCFTEDWATARAMVERGFFVSFSGILTFPKAGKLRGGAARVPLDRLP